MQLAELIPQGDLHVVSFAMVGALVMLGHGIACDGGNIGCAGSRGSTTNHGSSGTALSADIFHSAVRTQAICYVAVARYVVKFAS